MNRSVGYFLVFILLMAAVGMWVATIELLLQVAR